MSTAPAVSASTKPMMTVTASARPAIATAARPATATATTTATVARATIAATATSTTARPATATVAAVRPATATATAARPATATPTSPLAATPRATATASASPARVTAAASRPPVTTASAAARPAVSFASAAPASHSHSRTGAAVASNPLHPADSSLASERARRTTPRNEPPPEPEPRADDYERDDDHAEPAPSRTGRAEGSAPTLSDEPAPAAEPLAASGQPWVPPGWKGPTGGRGGRGRGVTNSHGAYPPDLQAELERVRRSFEDVCRERDVLRSHVSKMESLIHERVGAQFRSSSAPRAGTSSAPATPKGGSGSSASLGGRPGSASPKARKLTKEAELEFLRRQQRYGWAPDRSSKLSGVEQLKKHLEAAEKKALEATTKVKIKRYQTKAELEEATKAMFERGAPDTARDHTRSAASERRRAECPPPPPHTHPHTHTRGHAEAAGLPYRSLKAALGRAQTPRAPALLPCAPGSQELAREARRLR